jgi:hypothetical protein
MKTFAFCLAVAAILVPCTLVASAASAQQEDDYLYQAQFAPATQPVAPRPPDPPEPPSPRFGAKGEVVIAGDTGLGISSTQYDGSDAASFSVGVAPDIDYFIATNLSVGLTFGVSYGNGKGYGADGSLVDTKSTTVSGGPAIGYNIPLGEAFSLWPTVNVGFEWARQEEQLVSGSSLSVAASPLGYPTTTRTGPYVGGYLPLLLHPKPHLFIGFGPSFFHDFGPAQGGPSVGGQRTNVGAGLTVGGWFGGPPPAAGAEPGEKPRERRFGSAGEVVLANDIVASAHSQTYAGSAASTTTVSVAPSFDVFVADHFSIGVAVTASYSNAGAADATTGAPVTNSRTTFGIAPRVAVDVPVAPWLSFNPRASIGFASGSYDEKSAASENQAKDSTIWTGIYAPLLVHPASHVFAGFGPSVTYELSHAYGPEGFQNRATTLGAGFTVGGWL